MSGTTRVRQTAGPREEAKAFLMMLLHNGPVPSIEIEQQAKEQGITPATLRRAKSECDIRSIKIAETWYMQAPGRDAANSIFAHPQYIKDSQATQQTADAPATPPERVDPELSTDDEAA